MLTGIAEALLCRISRIRRSLFERGILRSRELPRPVISIGNLAVGGAGKTPLTIAVARHLIARGERVTILTRGYGRSFRGDPGIVNEHDALRFGDEPVLMARRIPGVTVVVGGDRYRAGTRYLENHDCDLFLLDDGFQHLQLSRDIDIVILDPRARWHREGPEALGDADLVVVRQDGELVDESVLAGRFAARLEPVAIHHEGVSYPIEDLQDRRVVAFAGLATNDRFFEALERLGAIVVEHFGFPDHHRYTTDDLAMLRQRQADQKADLLICTEKDGVKIGDDRIATLEVEMVLPQEFYDRLVARLEERRAHA